MEQICDDSENIFWLVDVPGDGDCLFGSIVHQLFGMTPKHPLFKTYSQQVRENAVSEIRQNLHLYYETVSSYADELIPGNYSIEEKMGLYLNRLLTAGYWGGADSIAALSNHYNVVFVVHQTSCTVEFSPTNSETDNPSRHHLFYRNCRYLDEKTGIEYLKIHYDSVFCIRKARATFDSHDTQIFNLPGSPPDMRVKVFGSEPDAFFYSILHQLTGEIVTDDMIFLVRCLIADEIESRPSEFLPSCGFPCETIEDISQFAFHLRIGRHTGGLASLLVLTSVLPMTIFMHHAQRGVLRYDPSGEATMSIQILESPTPSGIIYGSVLVPEHARRRLQASRALPDPMVIAQKVARKELTDSQMTDPSSVSVDPKRGLRFASLNVNGCRASEKREAIDALLFSHRVQIAVLQEVNLECQYVSTPHFQWHMGGRTNNRKRGLAILVYNDLNAVIQSSIFSGAEVQHAEVFYQAGTQFRTLDIINVHGPNCNADRFFGTLGTVVGRLKSHHHLIVAGDFNSHLSNSRLSPDEAQLIGKYAGHEHFNENGLQMKLFLRLHSLAARSTQSISNESFRWTWSNGTLHSQVDHLLTSLQSKLYLRRLQCTKPQEPSTDHKLLLCNIAETSSNPPSTHSPIPSRPNPSVRPRFAVNPSLLKMPDIRQRYQTRLSETNPSTDPSVTVEDAWKLLKEKVYDSAKEVLEKTSTLPPTRECRRALADVKKYSFWANRSHNPKWAHKLAEARETLRSRLREYEENEIQLFFQSLQQYPAGERINRTFQYLKRFNKKNRSSRGPSSVIRLNDWVLDDSSPSLIPDALEESTDAPILDAPTLREVQDIVSSMKNGKTPGVDSLYAEYFKYCDDSTIEELHRLLVRVWTENDVPSDWKHVIIVPIPKVKNPRTTSDYRRICLSCTAYKVYASWILQKMQNILPPIGYHQAAFLPERSTIDHLHILQRILQERWNGGKPTLLMSLDIEKAFDRISLESLPAILRAKGAPVSFINRVLECLRGEQQQVLWRGQLTRTFQRRRGIKQGCPLSPFIFNLIMEAVLESVADEVPNLRLNQTDRISLPLILAFADDLIIIVDNEDDLRLILSKLKEYLSYVGLNLNPEKCRVLIRDPTGDPVPELRIDDQIYKTTDPLRYLGIYLTSKLERPMTVRTRCRNAVRVSKAILDFLKKYQPSWEVGRVIYESVIAPSMLYGTQVAVLTKYSRRSLRGYERQIVHNMYSLCRGFDSSAPIPPINRLLRKKRITKKVRMYQMRWWGHVRRRGPTHPLRCAARMRATRLRACRPSFTWWDSIRQNMDRYGDLEYDEWKELAQDKERYHQKLLQIYDIDESDNSDWETIADES